MPSAPPVHSSASIRSGTTLVPQTVAIVAAVMGRTSVPEGYVPDLIRGVHGALLDIAVGSISISEALHSLGYLPSPDSPASIGPGEGDLGGEEIGLPDLAGTPLLPFAAASAPSTVDEPDFGTSAFDEPVPSVPSDVDVPLPRVERASVPAPRKGKVVRRSAARGKASGLGQLELEVVRRPVPAKGASPRTSIQMDFIQCLEDGRKVRNLAQHLVEAHGMTPEAYRTKWGLHSSYPMQPPGAILKRGEQFEFDPVVGSFRTLRR